MFLRKKEKNLFFSALNSLFLLFIATDSFAGTTGSFNKNPFSVHPVITISAGAAVAKVGQSQTLTMDGDFTEYRYSAGDSHSNQLLGGVFVGTESFLSPRWGLQFGLGFYIPKRFSAEGILSQGIDIPSSDLFTYRYKVRTSQLLVEGKLLYIIREQFYPYVVLGLGTAFNRAYDYSTTVPPFLTFTPQFMDHKTTHFSYSVGAGLDINVLTSLRLGAGYRFADFGKTNLGDGTIDVLPFTSTLQQSHLYVHQAMVQLTYLI